MFGFVFLCVCKLHVFAFVSLLIIERDDDAGGGDAVDLFCGLLY